MIPENIQVYGNKYNIYIYFIYKFCLLVNVICTLGYRKNLIHIARLRKMVKRLAFYFYF